ncbi:uncharacterized protein LOC110594819, partial [Carlito syrichta]|uniref:Uncharacterized protein LOC110594819 n=1 Tax=Carlito syrichta TaxID=1868482 RepID=A0A3Q0DPB1_CARSF
MHVPGSGNRGLGLSSPGHWRAERKEYRGRHCPGYWQACQCARRRWCRGRLCCPGLRGSGCWLCPGCSRGEERREEGGVRRVRRRHGVWLVRLNPCSLQIKPFYVALECCLVPLLQAARPLPAGKRPGTPERPPAP